MLERRPTLQPDRPPEAKQRQRLLIAIVLLLTALAVLLIKDRYFWLGSAEPSAADAETGDTALVASDQASVTPARPAIAAKSKQHVKHTASKPDVRGTAPDISETPVVTKRTVLPPLSIEVVTGEAFRKLHPGNDGLKVEIQSGSTPGFPRFASERAALSPAPVSHGLERGRMSAETTQSSAEAADPSSYPVLAKQMRVQGSVVLQALIGSDGLIQDLRVLSGPVILASAAREAVRQWRFKPYLQDGQPIETLAKITVNFVISTS